METVGGQALIEGVLIKAGQRIGVAVRDPAGNIHVKSRLLSFPFSKIPFIRGVVNLLFLLYIGAKELHYSSKIALAEQDAEASPFWLILSLLFSFALALFLFKFLPLAAAEGVTRLTNISYFVYNLIDGLVKIVLFVGYVSLLLLVPDMRRVFQYHGAEHKVVNCYEAKKPLTQKYISSFSTIHQRCGTNFVFLVLFLSIFVYTFIPASLPFLAKFGLRIALLPVVASLSYEILFAAALVPSLRLFSILVFPGLLLQRITTQEPDRDQIAVAVAALRAAVIK